MKKIMFNDTYGLTQSVLDGRKTQTRRIIKDVNYIRQSVFVKSGFEDDHGYEIKPRYKVGEVVAVAQSYEKIAESISKCPSVERAHFVSQAMISSYPHEDFPRDVHDGEFPAYTNKMFVKAELMPRKIRITGIGIERLQDISNEDSLKEGIVKSTYRQANGNMGCYYWYQGVTNKNCPYGQYIEYNNPREAFASLIDEVSGKDTWDSNPYVFVYDFELVKENSL